MISVQNLGVEFSAKPLFHGVSYVINRQDRIGLAGKNGAGKSTMLKIISGLQQPTEGSVAVPEGVTIGYLPQQMNLADTTTVMEETRKAFDHINRQREELEAIENALRISPPKNGKRQPGCWSVPTISANVCRWRRAPTWKGK